MTLATPEGQMIYLTLFAAPAEESGESAYVVFIAVNVVVEVRLHPENFKEVLIIDGQHLVKGGVADEDNFHIDGHWLRTQSLRYIEPKLLIRLLNARFPVLDSPF